MGDRSSRRAQKELKDSFPFGFFAGLVTAAAVTLLGVYLRFEPTVILTRAVVSAAVVGLVISLCMGFIRILNTGSKRRRSRTAN